MFALAEKLPNEVNPYKQHPSAVVHQGWWMYWWSWFITL